MSKKNGGDEVQQLMQLGKEKGFLTYDEVNDILPPDMISSDQLDDVMSMFGDMDIEVVDAEQKIALPQERDPDAVGEEARKRLNSMPTSWGAPAIPCACTCGKWGRSPC